ncbi:MAG: glycosyltransferase involved in cell wall biosynthesis, partial [Parasphingorhabdus sp.]
MIFELHPMPITNTVSCVIPAFNSSQYIEEAINSVLSQTYSVNEIIVVDGGSKDHTVELARAFGGIVRVVRHDDLGPASSRNTGVRQTSGQYICFLDADDRWHEHKIELQMEEFSKDSELDICCSMAENFWAPELSEEYERLRDSQRAQPVPAYITGATLARRELFNTVGLLNEKLWFADGMDWFLRARRHKVKVVMLN